jgi:hypothetical protein
MPLPESDLGPNPTPLGETMPAITGNLQCLQPHHELVQRLLRKFGRGDKPSVTTAFYHKIADLVEKHGDRAYQAVAEAMAQSVGKRSPTRYFARTVVIKFRELGWWNPVVP